MFEGQKIWGVDYGSKMAGTTVVAIAEYGRVKFHASAKKQDADQMILDLAKGHQPELIAIDAPLSLPGVYQSKAAFDNYFYRACDRELNAMSPMFLGGLTARAMKLAAQLPDTKFIEAYPVYSGNLLGLKEWGYRSKSAQMEGLAEELTKLTGWEVDSKDLSSHHIDAVLALYIAHRFITGKAESAGKPEEGLIYY